jgi:hypothetical protein
MHFHKWEEFWDVYFGANQISYTIERTYRHCKNCGKWQRYHCDWGEVWWADSDIPNESDALLSKNVAMARIKIVKMRKESF